MFRQILLVAALMVSFSAYAGPQQEKMKACNEQAAGKKGDDRKVFMKTCLSAPASASDAGAALTPQERMKKCNEQAKGKTGDERKTFMSQCLKVK